MPTVAWIMFWLYVVIAVAAGAMLRPLWRATRKYPQMRSSLVVWAVLVGLAATVPVVIVVTGRAGWYPGAVGAGTLAIAAGHAWVRRGAVRRALRPEDTETGGPVDRP